jgi:hypothetical protein
MSPIIVYRQLLINSMRKCVYLLDGAPHLERINRLRHLGKSVQWRVGAQERLLTN